MERSKEMRGAPVRELKKRRALWDFNRISIHEAQQSWFGVLALGRLDDENCQIEIHAEVAFPSFPSH